MKKIINLLAGTLLLFSLSSCSGSSGSSQSAAGSDSMHFELPGGILDYVNYEYVSPGFYFEEGDYTKTICFNFDYTNKEDDAKSWQQDFWLRAYQNGNELDYPKGYTSDSQPETMKNSHDTVLKDGTLHFGVAYVLEDYSPVTFIANHNGGKETSDKLVIEIEPYQDNSFDLDRLYGIWKSDDPTLTITSSRISLDYEYSSTYFDNPKLWTDETTLYTPLYDLPALTIKEVDGTLHLTNDEFDFVQEENWSEAASGASELTEVTFGETISTEFVELLLDEQDITDEIVDVYTSSGGGITIKNVVEPAKTDTLFVYAKGTVKNISSNSFDPENMKSRFVIDGKYEIDGKVSALDGDGSDTLNLEPLNTKLIYIDAGIDSATAESAESIDLYIGFERSFSGSSDGNPEGSTYYYKIKLK